MISIIYFVVILKKLKGSNHTISSEVIPINPSCDVSNGTQNDSHNESNPSNS